MQIEITSRLVKYALSIAVPLSVAVYVFASPGKPNPNAQTAEQPAKLPRPDTAPESPSDRPGKVPAPDPNDKPKVQPLPATPPPKRIPRPTGGRRIPKPKTRIPAG